MQTIVYPPSAHRTTHAPAHLLPHQQRLAPQPQLPTAHSHHRTNTLPLRTSHPLILSILQTQGLHPVSSHFLHPTLQEYLPKEWLSEEQQPLNEPALPILGFTQGKRCEAPLSPTKQPSFPIKKCQSASKGFRSAAGRLFWGEKALECVDPEEVDWCSISEASI